MAGNTAQLSEDTQKTAPEGSQATSQAPQAQEAKTGNGSPDTWTVAQLSRLGIPAERANDPDIQKLMNTMRGLDKQRAQVMSERDRLRNEYDQSRAVTDTLLSQMRNGKVAPEQDPEIDEELRERFVQTGDIEPLIRHPRVQRSIMDTVQQVLARERETLAYQQAFDQHAELVERFGRQRIEQYAREQWGGKIDAALDYISAQEEVKSLREQMAQMQKGSAPSVDAGKLKSLSAQRPVAGTYQQKPTAGAPQRRQSVFEIRDELLAQRQP